jgi:hypothetical protein
MRVSESQLAEIINDPKSTTNERDAAAEGLNAIRFGEPTDGHVTRVLFNYFAKRQQQNRYGQ